MKNLLFIIAIINSLNIIAQSLPNVGFENWETLGSGMNSYQEPENWNTLNSDLSTYFVSADVTKSNDSHSGIASVKLETKSVAGVNTPAVLTIGTIFSTGTFDRDVRGGIPCNQKPVLFEGWYKYSPQGNDEGYIACLLFKFNSITKKQDTVGAAIFKPTTSNSQYLKFSINFDYNSYLPNETPDSMNIIITSSYKYTVNSSNVGSILLVDDLNINLNSGIEQQNNFKYNINYLPSNTIVIDQNISDEVKVTILSIAGKEISMHILNGTHLEINTFDLARGAYIIRLETKNENITKKLWVY